MTNRQLAALRRKLERLELDLLRRVVAWQGERIEQLQDENARLADEAAEADRFAHFWREQHDALQDAYYSGSAPPAVGVTRDGALVIVHNDESPATSEPP